MSLPGTMSLADFHAMRAKAMTEKTLQDVIIQQARLEGFLIYHTYDSRRSAAGYPDLHLVHPTRKLSIFRELKTQTGKISQAQLAWIEALTAAGQDAGFWRPIDWFDNTITNTLRKGAPTW